VPLRSGGYGIGVVARMDGGGGILGYFFGPKTGHLPSLEVARGKEASDALLVCKLGDLGLLKDIWKVLGRIEPWRRAEWPIPVFLRTDRVSGTHHKVIYADDNLLREVDLLPCSAQEAATLPEDGLYGAGAVERVLTKLLSETSHLE